MVYAKMHNGNYLVRNSKEYKFWYNRKWTKCEGTRISMLKLDYVQRLKNHKNRIRRFCRQLWIFSYYAWGHVFFLVPKVQPQMRSLSAKHSTNPLCRYKCHSYYVLASGVYRSKLETKCPLTRLNINLQHSTLKNCTLDYFFFHWVPVL